MSFFSLFSFIVKKELENALDIFDKLIKPKSKKEKIFKIISYFSEYILTEDEIN